MKKAFYFDVETTGLSSYKHDIIQIACLIEINGETVEEFTSLVAPFAPENADDRALKIHGHSLEDMLTFPSPVDVYNKLIKVLGKHVNKFNKADKFIPIGYNVSFDISFLQQFFKKCGDKYYGSLITMAIPRYAWPRRYPVISVHLDQTARPAVMRILRRQIVYLPGAPTCRSSILLSTGA